MTSDQPPSTPPPPGEEAPGDPSASAAARQATDAAVVNARRIRERGVSATPVPSSHAGLLARECAAFDQGVPGGVVALAGRARLRTVAGRSWVAA